MRVISGTAGGRRLAAPASNRVRPALDKIKGAIFNILFDVEGKRVLDLFAGSGSIGIEALSRGASEAVFVEAWPPAIASIHKNLDVCGLTKRAKVIRSSAAGAIRRLSKKGEPFDLIFVDPPYLKDLVNPTLEAIASASLISDDAIMIVEHHPKEPIGEIGGLALTDSRKYGQTCVSFLKPSETGETR